MKDFVGACPLYPSHRIMRSRCSGATEPKGAEHLGSDIESLRFPDSVGPLQLRVPTETVSDVG